MGAFKGKEGNPQQLTFHSDQGTHYTLKALRKLLRMNKVTQSFLSREVLTITQLQKRFSHL